MKIDPGVLARSWDRDSEAPLPPRKPRTLGGPGSGNFGHAGRPGEVGGSGKGDWQSEGGFEHTGITWKQDVGPDGRPIPIKVASVEEAVALVLDGKVVELPDVKSAHTLIDRLAQDALEARAAGREAKTYDLCNVSVAGTNIFCGGTVRNAQYPEGIPRLLMPQLGGKPVPGSEADKLPRNPWDPNEVDGAAVFMHHLQSIGVKTETDTVPAASLRASQREMKGEQVGAMMRNKDFDPAANPVWVSKEGYLIDGHHRFAATLGRDAEDGKLGDALMHVIRVNAPISEVLHLANAWSQKFGIQQAAGVVKQARATGLHP